MPMGFRVSEWIALAYFGYLFALALLAPYVREPTPAGRRRVLLMAPITAAVIVALAFQTGPATAIARDWMPLTYLLFGYWLPAHLVGTSNATLERTLLERDHRLFGINGLTSFVDRAPRFLIEFFELAYLFCYPLVPLGFAWLVLAGYREESDRFWTAVLLAGFLCYGLLPWLPTRAPRAIEPKPARVRSSIRALNLQILDRASVQLNTFPSGHTAASFATALAVGVSSPVGGVVLGFIALGISIGSIIGRYHYAADAISGASIALAAFAISRLV
jgi:PAP2 superfamily protein